MLEAADELFSQLGFDGASMDDIAAKCGISKPMLYAYFGSKEGLFAACGLVGGERLRERLRKATADESLSAEQLLWRGLMVIFTRIEENRDVWVQQFPSEGPAPAGPLGTRAAMNRAGMTDLVAQLMREAALRAGRDQEAAEQVVPLAHALVGAVLGVAGWWFKHPDEPPEFQALRVMNFAWQGLERLTDGELWMPAAA